MQQPAQEQMLLHLLNLSGYTASTFHRPTSMRDITISVKGMHESARVAGTNEPLAVENEPLALEYVEAHIGLSSWAPGEYEVIVLK